MEECCALCENRAMMHCDSDQANLCWDCDEKVHSANFLVARHSRILLCSLCYSHTPWKASGPKLTPTVSFCHRCVADRRARFSHVADNNHHLCDYVDDNGEYSSDHIDDDEDENDYDSDDDDVEEGDDGENQVVPMSSASASFSVDSNMLDETVCSSSQMFFASDESTSMSVLRPLKEHRINEQSN
ncbi:zinc finger protein CONSTANS-LIKE 2-like [Gastrolobium bilobum]|uniref:zinc finger protein CONSTANS-LIKE 2-like n=1 Tax=Gastrolobium bilobum TaxID=150636 RepID=UPI002AB27D92|nr:zinc finger protein CONSTANS-LIKE 2-like [Gastrolobium bilobum]